MPDTVRNDSVGAARHRLSVQLAIQRDAIFLLHSSPRSQASELISNRPSTPLFLFWANFSPPSGSTRRDWGERTWPNEKLDSRVRPLLSLHTSHKRRLYLALTSSQVDSAKRPRTFGVAILGPCGRHSVSQSQQFCSGAVEFGRRSLQPPSLWHG